METLRSYCSKSVALSSGESNSGISSKVEGIAKTVGDLSCAKSAICISFNGDWDFSTGKFASDDLLLKILFPSGDSGLPKNFGLFNSLG